MNLELVTCDLCGGDNYIERYRKPDTWLWLNKFEYPVVQCLDCGLVYVNPRPIFEETYKFYPPGYHENRDDETHKKRYELQFSYIENFRVNKILDIGCAQGDWLNYIKSRWSNVELYGIDAFSPNAKVEDINFQKCQLPDSDLPDNYFDLITSWAVFEHLHNPGSYFEIVSKKLKKGGKFVFLVTNSESFYGKYAYQEDIPRHLYHFNEKTLHHYANINGLRLSGIFFDNRLWDGRGFGTFRFQLGWLTGLTWRDIFFKKYNPIQRLALKMGAGLDRLIFYPQWESYLGQSGIIIGIMEK